MNTLIAWIIYTFYQQLLLLFFSSEDFDTVDILCSAALTESEMACLSDQFQMLSACFNCTILHPYG